MTERLADAELVDAFLSQEDRCTHSGLVLSDCFSQNHFDLVFAYATVVQKSAVRQALIACLSLPSFDPRLGLPPRNATFEKHLENLLLHALRAITNDGYVARADRVSASLLLEAAAIRARREPGIRVDDAPPTQPDPDQTADVTRPTSLFRRAQQVLFAQQAWRGRPD
jgi:hypothetical protein